MAIETSGRARKEREGEKGSTSLGCSVMSGECLCCMSFCECKAGKRRPRCSSVTGVLLAPPSATARKRLRQGDL